MSRAKNIILSAIIGSCIGLPIFGAAIVTYEFLQKPYIEQEVQVDGFDGVTCQETYCVQTTAWSRRFPAGWIIEMETSHNVNHDKVEREKLEQGAKVGYAMDNYIFAIARCAR